MKTLGALPGWFAGGHITDTTELRRVGTETIASGSHDTPIIPFSWWTDFNLRSTIEYPVRDLPLEVGFYASALGLAFPVLSEDYAIGSDSAMTFTFAMRQIPDAPTGILSLFKLQWYVDNLDEIAGILSSRGVAFDITEDAPRQRVIHITSPNGMPIEIWSGEDG